MASKFGQGVNSRLLYQEATSGTTPVVALIDLEDFDVGSLHLIVENNTRTVVVTGTDSVVAISGTWTFANAVFTTNDVGGTITVTGATNAGNNGTFTILTRVSATVITTATTGLVNETFSASVGLTVTGAPVTGSWLIEGSNDYAKANWGGQNATAGHWADLATLIYPALVSVTAPYPAASGNQLLNFAPLGVRTLRATLTPATKAGLISVFGYGKSSS